MPTTAYPTNVNQGDKTDPVAGSTDAPTKADLEIFPYMLTSSVLINFKNLMPITYINPIAHKSNLNS